MTRASKLDRKNIAVTTVLSRMRRGVRLHLEYTARGPRWWCGDRLVDDDIARRVISNEHVHSADITLFGVPAQTFWWAD